MGESLALGASLIWGTTDFLGGRLSRRLATSLVIALPQVLATVLLCGYVAVSGAWRVDSSYATWAVAAGLLWVLGLVALYEALSKGPTGVVAPVASCGVLVPVAVGVAIGDLPRPVQFLGVAAACVGVICSSGPDVRRVGIRQARPLALAAAAALAFGGEIVLLARASQGSIPMTLLVMRVAALAVIVGARHEQLLKVWVRRTDLPALAVLGLLDVAAMCAFGAASRLGSITVIAVLASLYPAVTVLLAWWFHIERLRPSQAVGVVLTVAGAGLIAAGSVG